MQTCQKSKQEDGTMSPKKGQVTNAVWVYDTVTKAGPPPNTPKP